MNEYVTATEAKESEQTSRNLFDLHGHIDKRVHIDFNIFAQASIEK